MNMNIDDPEVRAIVWNSLYSGTMCPSTRIVKEQQIRHSGWCTFLIDHLIRYTQTSI